MDEPETTNQRQARLRREKRQAKLASGGNDRLNKIMGVQGHAMPEAPSSQPTSGTATPNENAPPPSGSSYVAPSAHEDTPDPEEMMVSEHYYEPRRRADVNQPAMSPFGMPGQMAMDPGAGDMNEQMMKLMQQLMTGQEGGGPGGPGGEDPMAAFAKMFGGNPEAMQGMGIGEQQPVKDSTYIWRIVHAIASLGLALLVVLSSSVKFTGSEEARKMGVMGGDDFGSRLFFWFATAEVVLQSSRYFLERGQLPRSGMLGMVQGFLPEPYAGYLRLIGRYSTIFSTIWQDGLVILFVLGAVAWWNGRTAVA